MFYTEFYSTQEELLERIEELKDEDYYEEDLHLASLDKGDDMSWLEYTNIHFHPHHEEASDGGFKGIFSNKEPSARYLYKTGTDEETVEEYLKRLSKGEYLLCYSDHYKKRRADDQAGKDVSSESNLEVDTTDSEYDYK
ncbi:hypothetical protein [Corticicoccus populi]|uniref:General stress protein 17M-like domain-containing protein n=1 Tax=Corticicoccus populi TaxID=1812821 RepID=A0ABW5WWK3_9STAP